jgi:hypothetical protein
VRWTPVPRPFSVAGLKSTLIPTVKEKKTKYCETGFSLRPVLNNNVAAADRRQQNAAYAEQVLGEETLYPAAQQQQVFKHVDCGHTKLQSPAPLSLTSLLAHHAVCLTSFFLSVGSNFFLRSRTILGVTSTSSSSAM